MPDSFDPASPIDLPHLRRQTGGDAGLEREVLTLFLSKSAADLARISEAATDKARREAAHSLVGSARAIGATTVAQLAAAAERGGSARPALLAELSAAVAAAQAFIEARLLTQPQ